LLGIYTKPLNKETETQIQACKDLLIEIEKMLRTVNYVRLQILKLSLSANSNFIIVNNDDNADSNVNNDVNTDQK